MRFAENEAKVVHVLSDCSSCALALSGSAWSQAGWPDQTAGKDERFQKAVRQASQEPIYRNAADFARVLAEDSRIKQDVIKRAGIKAP